MQVWKVYTNTEETEFMMIEAEDPHEAQEIAKIKLKEMEAQQKVKKAKKKEVPVVEETLKQEV